uniref:BRD4-interacting chromatin-remodeling complex-associated protein n=1 Tax=Camelus bactrianus TaxID=9837 RepID=A0A9W3FU33_CAMBA|nr:BRD4-interacting chromatin-remodeling complex-associated protein [Camelus bactrianus]
MDDEDGRCLLDVICDPQALNDFLHGSEKLDSDDLLDNPGEAQSAFYEGPGLHVQEASGNHLNPEPSQPAPSVDLDFLEDDILGSPSAGGGSGGGGGADQPCDILQQSLQEANITEQTLEAEAELDLGPFQLPTLQPTDGGAGPAGAGGATAVATGPQALFPGGADLLGLQAPPTVLTHQALVPPQDVVNKALSVQPFLQPVGLGNVTLQPIPGLQGLPNALAVAPGLGTSPLVPAPNVILHRTPTPIQPKPAGVLPPKLYQLTPKPFAPAGATLTIQGEAGGLPQQPKAPQNLTFMAAGKAGQNVVLSGFPAPALQANVFKQPPATTTGAAPPQPPGALSKPMSVHLLNQGSSIVIPAQHMLPGQSQILLPGTSAVQLPQPFAGCPFQERSQQPLSTEGPHLSVPASVIVSAPPPAQEPAPTTPVAKGAGLGPQAPDSQASPAPAPQMVTTPFPALPQPKALLERFHQVPSGIILQSKAVGAPAAPQTSASLGPLTSPTASVLVSGQAPSGTPATPSHPPAPAPMATAGLPPLLPAESKAFASNLQTLSVAKAAASGPGKSSGMQYESKSGSLKKPPTLQPSKEACFLEHLHKHQGSVLHPDYKTAFPSFEDALHRLLPYHVYQGALPSPNDYHKVDEEFETVSTQLLKRTQAMLNKYRLLLLEESRRVSPSAEMVMIDRMFIQEEKTTLALDKQLAKEKPDEYVSSSRSLGLPVSASSDGHRLPGHGLPPSSASGAPAQPPLHLPTKLVIRHGGAGGSPSVTWARASSSSLSSSSSSSATSSLDADEDGPMPSRNRPPLEPGWEAPPLPPAKRRKSESPDVDQASFSSDSPQDDTLTEHLQSAIDSILNLQQAPGRTPAPPYSHAAPTAVTAASRSPLHRPEAYPPSSHNGGLGARTLNR